MLRRALIPFVLIGAACTGSVSGSNSVDLQQHIVQENETWAQIASEHSVDLGALQRLNCDGNETETLPSGCTGTPRVGRALSLPTETVVATTTTTSPPTTTTSPPTTTTSPPTTTTTQATTTTTTPPSGAFVEPFNDPNAFPTRFDVGVSGSGSNAVGEDFMAPGWPGIKEWDADHGMPGCLHPNTGSPSYHHVTPAFGATGKQPMFFDCGGGGPETNHLMTTFNTGGYNIAWFSPRQMFSQVTKVCWDQNLTDLGGGKWTSVLVVADEEVGRFQTEDVFTGQVIPDLAYTGPGFQDQGGPTTMIHAADWSDVGGFKGFLGGFEVWRGTQFTGNVGYWSYLGGGAPGGKGITDKATRYTHCMTDNENGTLTISQERPANSAESNDSVRVPEEGNRWRITKTVSGSLPDGPARVVFQDDNYDADKHGGTSTPGDPRYTWHWDNIVVE